MSERSELFFPRGKITQPPSPAPKTHRLGRSQNPPQGTKMNGQPDTHSKVIGYLLWIFGFLGSHRFYYGKPITGTIWFFTLGLFFIGWIIEDRKSTRLNSSHVRISYAVFC